MTQPEGRCIPCFSFHAGRRRQSLQIWRVDRRDALGLRFVQRVEAKDVPTALPRLQGAAAVHIFLTMGAIDPFPILRPNVSNAAPDWALAQLLLTKRGALRPCIDKISDTTDPQARLVLKSQMT